MIFLVGYDGSNPSKAALDLACNYAKDLDAEIEVVTSMAEGGTDHVPEIKEAENQLKSAEAFANNSGVKANSHLLIHNKNPGEDLVDFAKEHSVDAIFVGVKKRSKVAKFVFGSNIQYIILKAPCPVMTVK